MEQKCTSVSPVFLVGAERSGTTLLRLMLDHHPDIRFLPEHECLVDYIGIDGSFPCSNICQKKLANDGLVRSYNYKINDHLPYPDLAMDLLQQGWGDSKALVFGATVHRRFNFLLKIWPNARFVHLIRDPRDVARSAVKMGWAGTTWHAVERWISAENLWREMVQKLSSDRFIELRYEDLVRDPEEVLSGVCTFLGLPYDKGMLSYSDNSTYGPVAPELAEQWKRKATPKEVRLVEARTGELLISNGYQPSDFPSLRVGPFRRKWLKVPNRIGHFSFNCRRYGFLLTMLRALNNRLPNFFRNDNVNTSIEAIDRKYVK